MPLPKLGKADRLEVHVRRAGGGEQMLSLPPSAATVVETVLAHLLRGERIAVLAEDGRSSFCAWIAASCRFAMSASTDARS